MAHPRNKYERRFLASNKRARKKSHAQQERDEAMLQAIVTEGEPVTEEELWLRNA